jgi:hypothetical protein
MANSLESRAADDFNRSPNLTITTITHNSREFSPKNQRLNCYAYRYDSNMRLGRARTLASS